MSVKIGRRGRDSPCFSTELPGKYSHELGSLNGEMDFAAGCGAFADGKRKVLVSFSRSHRT